MFILNIVGWLVTHWSTLTRDAEVKEDAVMSFGNSLAPHFAHGKIQELLNLSNFLIQLIYVAIYRGLCLLATLFLIHSELNMWL